MSRRCDIKTSEYLYGEYYDKEYVQQNLTVFYRQILWAKQLLGDLLQEPLDTRDFRRINAIMESVKWNQSKIDECYDIGEDK